MLFSFITFFSLIYPPIINIDKLTVQAKTCTEIKYFLSKIEKD